LSRLASWLLVSLALAVAGVASAAVPHTITHAPKNAAPGTKVTLGGQKFVVARVPVRRVGADKRYEVTFLAQLFGDAPNQVLFGGVTATHVTGALQGSNTTINGFPAIVTVSDSRSYEIVTIFDPQTFLPTNEFNAESQASVLVQVQLGNDTLLTFTFHSLFKVDDTDSLGAPGPASSYNAIPKATWNKYGDPTALVGFLNQLIDYINIKALN
jgi:hypothetical protein